MIPSGIAEIYEILLDAYGTQGWWPLYALRGTEGRDDRGYSKKPVKSTKFSLSEKLSPLSRFEIAAGAVLTQNTAWTNVEKSLDRLVWSGLLDPEKIRDSSPEMLAETIRSSGYYNQKVRKLKILASFLMDGDYLKGEQSPRRDDLLGLWGIGKETADSILLYAFDVPLFVVDAYTKRIFKRLGLLTGTEDYDEIALLFTDSLNRNAKVYQEYHALIVKHAKEHCRKQALCKGCVLRKYCLEAP